MLSPACSEFDFGRIFSQQNYEPTKAGGAGLQSQRSGRLRYKDCKLELRALKDILEYLL